MKTKTSHVVDAGAAVLLILAALVRFGSVQAAVTENAETAAWATKNTYGAVTVSNAGGGLVVVSFGALDPAQPPSALRSDVVVGGDPAVSPFSGDYVAAGVTHMAFKIRAYDVTNSLVTFILKGGSSGYGSLGLLWRHDAAMPSEKGVWVTNIVALKVSDGWRGGTAAQWDQDMRSVEFVGVRLSPRGGAAQSFALDSFILIGPNFTTAPALLVAFGDALEARFGVRDFTLLTAAQKATDADGDGMSDLNEILAGTNPDDRNSVFAAQVSEMSDAGVKIRWPCVEGGVYTVARTADLVGGIFTALPQGYRLTATSTGYMEFTDTTVRADAGPYFYRVIKE